VSRVVSEPLRDTFHPRFTGRHPGLRPFAITLGEIFWTDWPGLSALQTVLERARVPVATESGHRLRLVPPAGRATGADFEAAVYGTGALAVRTHGWHDLFNVLAWATYPRTKAAINARHVTELAAQTGAQRSRVRDALTAFDEDGVVVVSSDPELLALVRGFRWKALFWERREAFERRFRVFIVGHALAEKLLNPFVGLTAKAVLLPVDDAFADLPVAEQLARVDGLTAAVVRDPAALRSPRDLSPLPVLGIPGWWPEADAEAFYDDASYFRPGRRAGSGGEATAKRGQQGIETPVVPVQARADGLADTSACERSV
jgi:hypothetical protein